MTPRDKLNARFDAMLAQVNDMIAENERIIERTDGVIAMLLHDDDELSRPEARIDYTSTTEAI